MLFIYQRNYGAYCGCVAGFAEHKIRGDSDSLLMLRTSIRDIGLCMIASSLLYWRHYSKILQPAYMPPLFNPSILRIKYWSYRIPA